MRRPHETHRIGGSFYLPRMFKVGLTLFDPPYLPRMSNDKA